MMNRQTDRQTDRTLAENWQKISDNCQTCLKDIKNLKLIYKSFDLLLHISPLKALFRPTSRKLVDNYQTIGRKLTQIRPRNVPQMLQTSAKHVPKGVPQLYQTCPKLTNMPQPCPKRSHQHILNVSQKCPKRVPETAGGQKSFPPNGAF